jgi:glutamine amidotransferase
MIGIVDYGVGNTQAFMALFQELGIPAERASTSSSLDRASRLILPGVGHFDNAMDRLNNSGLRSKLEELVLERGVPIMGVCVGMQMLAEGSDEGMLPGLGWVPGWVRSLAGNPDISGLALPHMGWNDLQPKQEVQLFSRGFEGSPQFYFLHSYYFDASNRNDVVATTHYGIDFDSVVSNKHIHGIQCHPEKSHYWGKQLLKNFAEF